MKSHQTEFSPRDLLSVVGAPILVAAICAGVMHAGAFLGALPRPRPALDADRTILVHQVDAARNESPDIVLVGDSSCLMDVSALQLSDLLKRSVLNLGTLSYLDLDAYGVLLQENQKRRRPKVVVLLMHPEALRRVGSESHQLAVLNHYIAGRDHSSKATVASAFTAWTGVDIVSGRLLARWIPMALRGDYGAYYGFTHDLERFMTSNLGSAIDPGREAFKGSSEYRLSPTLEKSSRAFRAVVSPQTRLVVGITPVPAGFVRGGFPEERNRLLSQWTEWLGTTNGMSELPATLPDDQFARVTHLKPEAVAGYTASLGENLRKHLP
jgi:hypothetical protein